MKKYDYLVFIGRFQPFHAGHYHVMKKALEQAEKLIVVIGSHDMPRTARNPFTTHERIQLIKDSIQNDAIRRRIEFVPQVDHTYNMDKWVASIQGAVFSVVHRKFKPDPYNIGLVGFNKDHTSFYLKMFPQWDSVAVDPLGNVNSTEIRYQFFKNYAFGILPQWAIDNHHFELVRDLFNEKEVQKVRDEFDFIEKYKSQWKDTPYPVSFNTVDALVIQSGHILVVERGAQPGLGQLALPGGFVNQFETLRDAVIRELYEETKIDVPKPVIAGSIMQERIFDDPWRSQRGRTITNCYHIRLRDDHKLPKIKGSDDAAKAFWMPLDEFVKSRHLFYEDHYAIIETMLGL